MPSGVWAGKFPIVSKWQINNEVKLDNIALFSKKKNQNWSRFWIMLGGEDLPKIESLRGLWNFLLESGGREGGEPEKEGGVGGWGVGLM